MNRPGSSVRVPDRTREQGIALVIVLGILSLLVILGVAFSVVMRTERMAARSSVDILRARQLVHTALARVMDVDIEAELAGVSYPPWDAYAVAGSNDVKLLGDRTVNSPTVFVPASLRRETYSVEGTGVPWLPIINEFDGRTEGEFAFLVVNCSGLLDANRIGGSARARGADAGEIQFDNDVLDSVQNDDTLDDYRDAFGRFETVSELYYLGRASHAGLSASPPLRTATSINGPWADELHVFSRYPLGYATGTLQAVENVAYIGGDPSGWFDSAITNALADLSPGLLPDLNAFLAVMHDYADADLDPYPSGGSQADRFERISSEPVPMINEIVVTNAFELTNPTTLVHRVYVKTEVWYPFVYPANAPAVSLVAAGPPAVTVSPAYPNFSNPYNAVSASGPVVLGAGTPFAIFTNVYQQIQPVNTTSTPAFPPGSDMTVQVTLTNLQVDIGGSAVDLVSGIWPLLTFGPSTPPAAPSIGAEFDFLSPSISDLAVNDPRINWDPASSAQWEASNQETLSANNTTHTGWPAGSDEVGFMYARNAPFESVGELGYLLYDAAQPWETIRLVGNTDGSARILDRLTVANLTDYPRRGLVNINSDQTNALAATMLDMPAEKYDGDPAGSLLNAAQSRVLAANIISRMNATPATNLSDLAFALQASDVDPSMVSAGDKFRRESLVRNSIGLWGTRHQLYTVFIAARAFAENSDVVVSEQRAVAVIWRDPFVTGGINPSGIQYFQWLTGVRGK